MQRDRGMVINTNNCSYKAGPGLNSTTYSKDPDYRYASQSPQTYNDSWYVRETTTHGSEAPSSPKEEPVCSCGCWPNEEPKVQQQAMRCNNGPQSAASMVASYGVYHDAGLRSTEEEDGFVPRASAYRGVVVNASGGSSVVRPGDLVPTEGSSCGWCVSPQSQSPTTTTGDSCWIPWCRPTILLLVLVLLVVVFVLVSGILLYFNCMFNCVA